jgi:hypothetical protein
MDEISRGSRDAGQPSRRQEPPLAKCGSGPGRQAVGAARSLPLNPRSTSGTRYRMRSQPRASGQLLTRPVEQRRRGLHSGDGVLGAEDIGRQFVPQGIRIANGCAGHDPGQPAEP